MYNVSSCCTHWWGLSSLVGFIVACIVLCPPTEEHDEDDVGSPGPPCREYKAQCGQTGGQPTSEQHTQHQHRTHQPQHFGSYTSEYNCKLLYILLQRQIVQPSFLRAIRKLRISAFHILSMLGRETYLHAWTFTYLMPYCVLLQYQKQQMY